MRFRSCILISNTAVPPVSCLIMLPGIRMLKISIRNCNRLFRRYLILGRTCCCYFNFIGSSLGDCKSFFNLAIYRGIIFIPLVAIRYVITCMLRLCCQFNTRRWTAVFFAIVTVGTFSAQISCTCISSVI